MIHDYGTLLLTGAYGRYPTKQDWLDGKDFRIINNAHGQYCSIRDKEQMKKDGYKLVRIIYTSGRNHDTIIIHEETL